MDDLVSIIVPVYNVEAYLARCIDSIITQTYTNLEVILVDDGSPDECGRICDAYAVKDLRIHVIHKQNEGVGAARNTGLALCTGAYIMFVDSDDYLENDAIQVLVERIAADESDMVVGRHRDVYEDGSTSDAFCKWMKDTVIESEDVFAHMGDKNRLAVVLWAKLFRKEIFAGLQFSRLKCSEDLWLFPQIIQKCKKISVVNHLIYNYFQRGDSILHQPTDAQILDDIYAGMIFSCFLWHHDYHKSALWWFTNKIDKARQLKNKQKAIQLIETNFSNQELSGILKKAGMKTYLKWLALRYPVVESGIQLIKRWNVRAI